MAESRLQQLSRVRDLAETDPLEAARILETEDEEVASAILRDLDPETRTRLIELLDPVIAATLLVNLPPGLPIDVLDAMTSRGAVEVLLALPDDTRVAFLSRMSPRTRGLVEKLLAYPDNSAGRILRPQFLALPAHLTVKDAIRELREMAQKDIEIAYTYVTDADQRLTGVLIMRDLILASPEATLESIMHREVFTVNALMDREEVAREAAARRFLEIPVVDDTRQLLGTIKTAELITHVEEEATEDIQKLFGAGATSTPAAWACPRANGLKWRA